MTFLDKIRTVEKKYSRKQKIIISAGVLLFGICLGTFAKYLDAPFGEMPYFLEFIDDKLDLGNFLGGFAPWVLIAVYISINSQSPLYASLNVFLFFSGMVSSYYLYCNYIAGFFPKSYAMIWFAFMFFSPIPAFLCWYAYGNGRIAVILSAGILSILMNTAFAYGDFYFDVSSKMNLAVLLFAILLLHKSLKETIGMILLGFLFAFAADAVLPFHFW